MLFSQLRTFVFLFAETSQKFTHAYTHVRIHGRCVQSSPTDGNHVLTRNMTTCPCVVVDVVVHFA